MSKTIERFNAERDQELQKILQEASQHYSRLSEEIEEIKGRTEKRIVEFYREHPDEIRDVFSLIQDEVQEIMLAASVEAGSEPTVEDRKKLEEITTLYSKPFQNEAQKEYAEQSLNTLQPLLIPTNNQDRFILIFDAFFSDTSLKKRLYTALNTYIDLLREIAPDISQEAQNFIEDCITNKQRLVAQWEEQVKKSQRTTTAIANIITRRAKEVIFGVTKVEGTAFDTEKNDFLYNNLFPVTIDVGALKKRVISTMVSIDFNKMRQLGVTVKSEQRLTPYDREVHNAVSTLCVAGNKYITPQMIYQVLSGNKKDVKMTAKAREEILGSIDKMRFTEILIDSSQEARAGWVKEATYKGALIPSESVRIVTLNGQEVKECIHLFRTPPLYDYANDKNQIDRINIKMLNVPVSNTPENIELKGYLLRRIISAKNEKSHIKPIIRYDTLYKYLGLEGSNENVLRNKKKDIRDRTKEILKFWVAEGFIQGYEEEKEGKAIMKVRINL